MIHAREFWMNHTSFRVRYWAARACDWLFGASLLFTGTLIAYWHSEPLHWSRYTFDDGHMMLIAEPLSQCREWREDITTDGPTTLDVWWAPKNNVTAVLCDERDSEGQPTQ